MLKKAFITTCALFAFMQSSFGEIITFVENKTDATIKFKSNVFHSNGAERLEIELQENGRVHLELETRKNKQTGKIWDTYAPWWITINGKDFYVNWTGENIETVEMHEEKYQRVGSSNSRGKGYTAVFKNLKVNKNNGHGAFEGTIDMEFIPNY